MAKQIPVPAWMNDRAKRKYRELFRQVMPADNLLGELALLANSWATYETATEDIDKNGITLRSQVNGRVFVNPAVKVMNAAWRQIKKSSKAFGLSADAKHEEPLATFEPTP
jgi:P27 family predicted phage terminase small subunit